MELAEIIGLRPRPAAGLFMAVTGRCPLSCAHCSTDSSLSGTDLDQERFISFVSSFTAGDRPDVLMLTGGEPFLLPGLLTRIIGSAHEAGTRCAVLTGAFFARKATIPPAIRTVVDAVDHFSVSIDAFHEREVPRPDVFRLLRTVLDSGTPASIHTVGTGDDDPYLADLTTAVARAFGDQVPMVVNTVRPVGRGVRLVARDSQTSDHDSQASDSPEPGRDPHRVLPCAMAAWPVVAPDGEVVACCNQTVVDRRPVPAHLSLGRAGVDDWSTIRERASASPVLRAIRAVGPNRLLAGAGIPAGDYCSSCRTLGEHPAAIAEAVRVGAGPAGRLLAAHAATLQSSAAPSEFIRRHGSVRYAGLVSRRSAAETIRTKLALATPALDAVSARLWEPDGLRRRYPLYLRTMHGVLRASVPLMERAAHLCAEAGDDPLAVPLRDYLLRHSAEERGHDDWLLADLAAAGHDPDVTALAEPPSPLIARLVGAQYYWVNHFHPVALLGYIAVLESNAPAARVSGHIARTAGLPEAAVRTVRTHSALDAGHADAVFELIDRLPLTGPQTDAITTSALATADALLTLYTHLIRTTAEEGRP